MKISLRYKIAGVIIIMMAVLSGTLIYASSRFIMRTVDTQFRQRATDLANTVASTMNTRTAQRLSDEVRKTVNETDTIVFSDEWGSDAFNEYVSKFSYISDSKYYAEMVKFLRSFQDVNDVDCIYTSIVDNPNKAFIYVVDAAYEDACMPGVADPLYEMNQGLLTDPSIGFPAYITDTPEYGWLVTAGAPVFAADGTVICYAMVDISMNEIRAEQRTFTGGMISVMAVLTLIVALISILLADRAAIQPLQKLTRASREYQKDASLESHVFENLDIHTGDEIEQLAESMAQMERNLNTQITEITDISDELYKTQTLAVKDALTGIRNKRGYNREEERLQEEINAGDARFGLAMIDLNFLKQTNDLYGHEKGDIALKRIADLICRIFLHSPVFRIGGDEFIVVLENNDLDKVEELTAEFYDELRKQEENPDLEPWEKISASLGYAIYDPEIDHIVEDVFRRADQAMYKKKVEMKAVRTV